MLRVVIERGPDGGETLQATCDAADSHRLVREGEDAVVELFAAAAGTPRAALRRTRDDLDEERSVRELVWTAPSGAVLALHGSGMASGHGVHGEDVTVRATGLPPGVDVAATWSVHHRRGGTLQLTVRGGPGVAELARRLGA